MRLIATIAAACLFAGCATTGQNYVPIIDTQGVDADKMTRDIGECQQYAKQTMDAAQGALVGAVAMGLVGAFLAPRGYKSQVAGKAAGIGALAGAGEAEGGQRGIISRCMVGRGYRVLN